MKAKRELPVPDGAIWGCTGSVDWFEARRGRRLKVNRKVDWESRCDQRMNLYRI